MIRFLLRMIGLWLVAGALVMAVVDGSRSLAAGAVALTPVGQVWFSLSPTTLNAAQAGVQRHVAPWLWDPVIQTALLAPMALVLIGLGFGLMLLGAPRKRVFAPAT
jgi:hypothetical protein